jgi:hypothetical protein
MPGKHLRESGEPVRPLPRCPAALGPAIGRPSHRQQAADKSERVLGSVRILLCQPAADRNQRVVLSELLGESNEPVIRRLVLRVLVHGEPILFKRLVELAGAFEDEAAGVALAQRQSGK